jgi:hypothetical protein
VSRAFIVDQYDPKTGKFVVVNNSDKPQTTVIYNGKGQAAKVTLDAHASIWGEG